MKYSTLRSKRWRPSRWPRIAACVSGVIQFEAPDLVVLPPRALRDLEAVLLVNRLGNELGSAIAHASFSVGVSGASLRLRRRRRGGRRPSSRARRGLPLRVPVASSAARATAASTACARRAERQPEVLRDQVEREERREVPRRRVRVVDAAGAGTASAGRASRRSTPSTARRARPARCPPVGDRARLGDRRHGRAGDQVVAELRGLTGAVTAHEDGQPAQRLEERSRSREGPLGARRP